MAMTSIEAVKTDANRNAKTLTDYLRRTGLIGESLLDGDGRPSTLRPYRDEQEEVLHGACLAAANLARLAATL
jgi:hypothetical protein